MTTPTRNPLSDVEIRSLEYYLNSDPPPQITKNLVGVVSSLDSSLRASLALNAEMLEVLKNAQLFLLVNVTYDSDGEGGKLCDALKSIISKAGPT